MQNHNVFKALFKFKTKYLYKVHCPPKPNKKFYFFIFNY